MSGFNEEERKDYRPIIFVNVFDSIRALVDAAQKLGFQIENQV